LIFDSWRKAWRPTALEEIAGLNMKRLAPEVARVVGERYAQSHHARAMAILKRGCVLLAVDAEYPEEIAAYAVLERVSSVPAMPPVAGIVHWVYVKEAMRRHGLARLLLDTVNARGACYTFHTRAGARLVERYSARFTPEVLYGDSGGGAPGDRGAHYQEGSLS
jgi:GNAT superfamily N-acetyltransferase